MGLRRASRTRYFDSDAGIGRLDSSDTERRRKTNNANIDHSNSASIQTYCTHSILDAATGEGADNTAPRATHGDTSARSPSIRRGTTTGFKCANVQASIARNDSALSRQPGKALRAARGWPTRIVTPAKTNSCGW